MYLMILHVIEHNYFALYNVIWALR